MPRQVLARGAALPLAGARPRACWGVDGPEPQQRGRAGDELWCMAARRRGHGEYVQGNPEHNRGSHNEGTGDSGTNEPTVRSGRKRPAEPLGVLLAFLTPPPPGVRGHRATAALGPRAHSPLDLLLDLFHQQRLPTAEPPRARCGSGAPVTGLHGPIELQRAAQEGPHTLGPHVQDSVRVAHLLQVPAEADAGWSAPWGFYRHCGRM